MTNPPDPSARHRDRAPDEPVTLADFLKARLDETDAAAKLAADESPPPWAVDGKWLLDANAHAVAFDEAVGYESTFPHIALHDPARVLREVEAGRKLLARWHEADSCRGDNAEDEARAWLLDGLLADRAAVWSGHGEFDKRWLT